MSFIHRHRRFVSVGALLSLCLLVACGGGNSSAVDAGTAPSVTTQPVSISVSPGASASFTVSAGGSAPLSYQWRKNGATIAGEASNSASLTIAACAPADAGSYDVVVSNAAGSVTSAAATLTINGDSASAVPSITRQPVSQTVSAGVGVTFTVVPSDASSVTFQWFKDARAIANATGPSLSVDAAGSGDAGRYTVTISNSAGSVSSTAATLAVTGTAAGTPLSSDVATAAQAFLATLSVSQQSVVLKSWSLDTARRWSNLPASMVARNGMAWANLDSVQKAAADALVVAALSASGNTLWQGMRAADDYLAANGGNAGTYGNGNYYVAFIGTPSATGFWVLQLTGHHLTYNLPFNGSYKSTTPQFVAAEPKGAFTQGGATHDPMMAQRTAASELFTSMVAFPGAKLSGTFSDLLFGANGPGGVDSTYPKSYPGGTTGRGLAYGSLSVVDQEKVKALIRAYVNTQAVEHADALLGSYLSDASLASTYVAYAGVGSVSTNGSYLRVDGPRVWIEYSVQRGIIFNTDIHYHTAWRDKLGDYGGRCCL